MNSYLYRYISFETFVGMVQSQSLTFVLPQVWEDPQEDNAFYSFVNSMDNIYEKIMFLATHSKTYAQCWTEQGQSDAMWRIYGYGERSVRIKISRKNVDYLDNVQAINVQYVDDLCLEKPNDFFEALTKKRKAFEHEKEVRLINHYKFKSDEDFEKHVKAFMIVTEHEESSKLLDNLYPSLPLDEQVSQVLKFLNIGKQCQSSKQISYAHIDGFIEGVMVHPLAPKWYVEIVKEFCNRNNLAFEGQSDLYSK